MQQRGITVIPTVSWSDERSYSFCFEGLPTQAVMAVSSVGVCNDTTAVTFFIRGFTEMLKRTQPAAVLFYGSDILTPALRQAVRIVNYPPFVRQRFVGH